VAGGAAIAGVRVVTSMADRYDRSAARYERWWAPVLAPTARALLDEPELGALIAARPDAWILDIGTGTGTLASAALGRWPSVRVSGVDASQGMLREARALARERLGRGARRLTLHRATAASLPFGDATFDVVLSSFVLQLVPNRALALREARRVLKRAGVLATVTWLADDSLFEPDEVFEDALDALDMDFDDEPEERRAGNFASPAAAAAQVRRAGFRDVRAEERPLEHCYDPAAYADFLEEYAEASLFEGLDDAVRDRLRADVEARLARLAPEEFVWRMPVVTVVARR
jgi:ubiquinone/menaquinone biosynthesis C-methylase UbiE